MWRSALLPLLAASLACAGERAAAPPPGTPDDATVLHAPELERVRCLLVAPFENGSDAPLADAAMGVLVLEIDPSRVRVFPVSELRALFRDTPLELPAGVGPSLALELAELLGADAVLYGSVEGHSKGGSPELLVNVRLSLVSDHRLLFARTVQVAPASGERSDAAVRRSVLSAARALFSRLGDPAKKRCFEPERTRALRKLALAEAAEPRSARPGTPDGSRAAAVAAQADPAPRASPRTPRQVEWTSRLEAGDRFVLEEVSFAGRSAELQANAGLSDLAVALLAQPSVSVRVEAFVDATADAAADRALSAEMAQAAVNELAGLGIPLQRVTAVGRGSASPRLPNFTARGRAANRRVEVVPTH